MIQKSITQNLDFQIFIPNVQFSTITDTKNSEIWITVDKHATELYRYKAEIILHEVRVRTHLSFQTTAHEIQLPGPLSQIDNKNVGFVSRHKKEKEAARTTEVDASLKTQAKLTIEVDLMSRRSHSWFE